jgi:hypothetical protein
MATYQLTQFDRINAHILVTKTEATESIVFTSLEQYNKLAHSLFLLFPRGLLYGSASKNLYSIQGKTFNIHTGPTANLY